MQHTGDAQLEKALPVLCAHSQVCEKKLNLQLFISVFTLSDVLVKIWQKYIFCCSENIF